MTNIPFITMMTRSINAMIQESAIILQRKDNVSTKRLKELWIGFGIDIDQWNNDTQLLLNSSDEDFTKIIKK